MNRGAFPRRWGPPRTDSLGWPASGGGPRGRRDRPQAKGRYVGGDPQALRRRLTTARARVSPEDVARLAFVGRDIRGRHAANRGMAQSAMDILLGRSIGTYGPIERGRHAPEHLFELIARVLKLNHQEWNSLWRYAVGKEPPFALD